MVKPSATTLALALALALSIGGLSWSGFMLVKQWQVNKALSAEVAELKASQVMLMVPDNQAQQLSDWLGDNPEQVDELIRMARESEQLQVEVEGDFEPSPGFEHKPIVAEPAPLKPQPQSGKATGELQSAVSVESVSEQGVKIIRLPHGGIRVTTREDN